MSKTPTSSTATDTRANLADSHRQTEGYTLGFWLSKCGEFSEATTVKEG